MSRKVLGFKGLRAHALAGATKTPFTSGCPAPKASAAAPLAVVSNGFQAGSTTQSIIHEECTCAQCGNRRKGMEDVSHGAKPDHEQAKAGLHVQSSIFSQQRVFLRLQECAVMCCPHSPRRKFLFGLYSWYRPPQEAHTATRSNSKPPASPPEPAEKTAKLFKNGRSQAVRLPKEFRFEGTEVVIRRDHGIRGYRCFRHEAAAIGGKDVTP